jgi:hypothetical protein
VSKRGYYTGSIFCTLVLLLLVSVGRVSALDDDDIFIHESVTGQDRDDLYEIMLMLPVADRVNVVVHMEDGRTLANRPTLSEGDAYGFQQDTEGTWKDPDAQVPTDFSSGSKLCGAVWSAGQIGSIASPHTFSSSDLIQIRTFDRLIPMFQTKVIRLRDVSGISETVSVENVQ